MAKRSCRLRATAKVFTGGRCEDLTMIDLYDWTTPNGHKITILLEEPGVPT